MRKQFTLLLATLLSLSAFSQNRGLNFDGVDDYVTIPRKTGVLNGNAFTVETWIKPAGTVINLQMLTDNYNYSTGQGLFLYIMDDRSIEVDLTTDVSGNSIYYSFPTPMWTNGWHHVAATYDGSTMQLFVDGNIIGSTPLSGSVNLDLNTVFVGRWEDMGSSDYFFNGTMDELRFWNVARTQTEIQANMNKEIAASTTNLTAYYKFNQGTANGNNAGITALTDAVASPNNGSLVNFALTGSLSNFSSGYVSLTILPVRNASFTAVKAGNSIQLSWKGTAVEAPSVFTIERSSNGIDFLPIGTVKGIAGPTETAYSFTDRTPAAVNYYRIKSTEFNGSVSYSKVLVVRMNETNANLLAYPNPVKNNLQVQLTAPKGIVEVEVRDLAGRTVQSVLLSSQGSTLYTSLDVSSLPRGTYLLKANNQSTLFVKQ